MLCYSGEVRTAFGIRAFTLTVGQNSHTWKVPETILTAQCLHKDLTCGEQCANVWPVDIAKISPSSYKLCANDLMKCW